MIRSAKYRYETPNGDGEEVEKDIKFLQDERASLVRILHSFRINLERVKNNKYGLFKPQQRDSHETEPDADCCLVADLLRNKSHDKRTIEERKWVSIDFKVNPHLYVNNASLVEIEQSDEYHSALSKQDIERLLCLPSTLHEAFMFLRTPSELEAYYLLRHYLGCHMRNAVHGQYYQKDEGKSPKNVSVVQSWGDIVSEVNNSCSVSDIFMDEGDSELIFEQAHLCIDRGNVVEHKFCVWSEHDRAVITRLTIVIVFRGYQSSFGRYAAGLLSARLHYSRTIDGVTTPYMVDSRMPYKLQAVNTKDSFGKIVILYEPPTFVECGEYEIVIRSRSKSRYCLRVDKSHATNVTDLVERECMSFAESKQRFSMLQENIDRLNVSISIGERLTSVAKR